MSATLVSSNTTIKVNAGVAATATTGGAGGTVNLYTAPANGYAIVQVASSMPFGGTISYEVATRPIPNTSSIYVGPSQTLRAVTNNVATIWATGVEFVNTP